MSRRVTGFASTTASGAACCSAGCGGQPFNAAHGRPGRAWQGRPGRLTHADAARRGDSGYSVADIATRLHLAEGTVRNYLSNAMQKTQTRTRHEAARYAREHDWL